MMKRSRHQQSFLPAFVRLSVFALIFLAPAVFLCRCGSGQSAAARIAIDVSGPGAAIDQRIYGHFIEHLDGAIYGGIWDLSAERLIPETVDLIRALQPPLMRWPGGCFSDTYHWEDGIGPRSLRPTRPNIYWGTFGSNYGPDDSNHFGTDEFMSFAEAISASPYVNVNFGSGTKEEAARWVEYVNGETGTLQGGLRLRNGHPSPYGVKLWGIGNEIFGAWETGHQDAAPYADRFLEFAREMKAVDPEIELVAVGCLPGYLTCPEGWNRTVLDRAGAEIDYLSLHIYLPEVVHSINPQGRDDYYTIVASPREIETDIGTFFQDIRDAGREGKTFIALDEWNLWWQYEQLLHSNFTLRDALFAAGVLNVLQRKSPPVRMANYAQIVNVLGLINTGDEGVFLSPMYYVFQLYSNYSQPLPVPVQVESETFSSRPLASIKAQSGVPYLDVSATVNAGKNRLAVFVTNRHDFSSLRTRLEIKGVRPEGPADVYELNAPTFESGNTFAEPETVKLRKLPALKSGSSLVYTFPAHSLTALLFTTRPD
ncbi:MAG: alpha-L-arabinofuranosidase C-terminal domain-containing protein [bacterium]|nr:alpha-L-arabinofuranosidase C-terminal domain-containing protein [bacterium]